MNEGMRINRTPETRRCPYCHANVGMGGDQVQICEQCHAWHHLGCWQEADQSCSSAQCTLQQAPKEPSLKPNKPESQKRPSVFKQLAQRFWTWLTTRQEKEPPQQEQPAGPVEKTFEQLEKEQAQLAYVIFLTPTTLLVIFLIALNFGWVQEYRWAFPLLLLWFCGLVAGWRTHPKLPNP